MKIWSFILFMTAGLLLGTACFSQELKSGDSVWAQWKPNDWHHGKIGEKTSLGFMVAFDDGDKADLPTALIVFDRPAQDEQLRIGARVLARWTDGRYYPGTVTARTSGSDCAIRFDDGATLTVSPLNLRLLNN